MKKVIVIWMVCCLICSLNVGLAAADGNGTGNTVQIKLKSGLDHIEINGESLQVQAPYESHNTTLVPLRVITTAFGAKLSWDSKTQSVGLSYQNHTIQLTIGSKEAEVDGQRTSLAASPEMKNDTTMVPIRLISENFGAEVVYDSDTGEIVITAAAAASDTPVEDHTASIDSDLGKTRIGNSYYGWMMKYPSGLVKEYVSSKGDYIIFSDAKGEYTLTIEADSENAESLTTKALLNRLMSDNSDTVLDSRTDNEAAPPYAKLVTKDSDNAYTETRSYFREGYVLNVYLTVEKAVNYTSPAKYQVYKDLLDSFSTVFESGDPAVKDLSNIKDGYRSYTNEDYGISLEVPAQWTEEDGQNQITFESEDGEQGAYIHVTSLARGDSLSAWVKRDRQDFMDTFVAEYRKAGEIQDAKLDNQPAKRLDLEITLGNERVSYQTYYVVKDGYKYEIGFQVPAEMKDHQEVKSTAARILNSVRWVKRNSALGYISDPNDALDKDETVRIKNSKYHYSFEIPQYWEKDSDSEDDSLKYDFDGGSLAIMVAEGITLEEASKNFEQLGREEIGGFTVGETNYSTVTMFDLPTREITFKLEDEGTVVSEVTFDMFEKDGHLYCIISTILKATDTKKNQERMRNAIYSFKFLE